MGLGLFIAKTLLERSGAELSFANGTDPFLTAEEHPTRSGAIVEVVWPRSGDRGDKGRRAGPKPADRAVRRPSLHRRRHLCSVKEYTG